MKRRYVRSTAGRPAGELNLDTFLGKVGAKIRLRRTKLGMTLDDVAAATNGVVSAAMMSQYEAGNMEPRLRKFLAICGALDATVHDLLPENFTTEGVGCSVDEIMDLLTDTSRSKPSGKVAI